MYIIIYYVTPNYPVLITSEFQTKCSSGQKMVIFTIFSPPYIKLKPILCMKSNSNIVSYLVHYNNKLTTKRSLRINCEILTRLSCMAIHTSVVQTVAGRED